MQDRIASAYAVRYLVFCRTFTFHICASPHILLGCEWKQPMPVLNRFKPILHGIFDQRHFIRGGNALLSIF